MDYLNRISLVRKLKIYLYIIITTFLLISIVLFINFSQLLTAESRIQMETISNYVREECLALLPIQYKLVMQLASDKTLLNFINTDYSTINSSFSTEQSKIDKMFYQIRQIIPNARIFIYHNNNTIKSANEFLIDLDTARNFDWLDVNNISQSQDVQWNIGSFMPDNTQYLICYKGLCDNFRPYELKMIVAIGVRTSDLSATYTKLDEDTTTLLFNDESSLVIASNGSILINTPDIITSIQTNKHLSGEVVKYNGIRYLTNYTSFSNNDINIANWSIVVLRPLNKILGKLVGAFTLIFLLITVIFAVLLKLTHFVSRNIVNRTNKILVQIDHIAQEDFSQSVNLSGSDEFYIIHDKLNFLAERLNFLIEKVYKYTIDFNTAQIEKQQIILQQKESEILALQNQINPHYFFNTLESIRMNLLLAGDEKNSEMIQFFAQSLRTYSKSPYDFVTIGEEYEFLQKYIQLQNYRFNGQIEFYVNIDESLFSYKIPRFILQPLVENAVMHGFDAKNNKYFIELSIFKDDDDLNIVVSDNGIGISEEQLAFIREHIDKNSTDGLRGSIGLVNVSRRLKLLYGDNCNIKICSKKNYGTEVEITIKKKKEEDKKNEP